MIDYYFDNVALCSFKGWVESWTGLYSDLIRKEPDKVDYSGQHGYRFDRSTIRYRERVITLTLVFNTDCSSELIRDNMKRLTELLSKNRPIRLMRVDNCKRRTDIWDVDLINSGSDKFYDDSMAQVVLTFHETAPVKAVYKCRNDFVSFEVLGNYSMLISWGDGTFDKVKNGQVSHIYTDGDIMHYIIISGVISDTTITPTNAIEECRIMC